LHETFNWYSNRFHLLLEKAETSYDNTSYKSNESFIKHSNCEVAVSMSTNCKNECGLKSLFADLELSECHKFESVGSHDKKQARS